MAMMEPILANCMSSLVDIFTNSFLASKIPKKMIAVIKVLYQTNGNSANSIALPKTPVNPHKNTAKCIFSNAFFIITYSEGPFLGTILLFLHKIRENKELIRFF